MKSFFERHEKLRKAMRKVDDAEGYEQSTRRKGRRKKRRRKKPLVKGLATSSSSLDAHGSSLGLQSSLPDISAAAATAALAAKRRPDNIEKVDSMITIDGVRMLVTGWIDVTTYIFELADPTTGASRIMRLSLDEVDRLSSGRFRQLQRCSNRDETLRELIVILPILLTSY